MLFGLPVFSDTSSNGVLVLVLVYFLSFFIKGAVGVGSLSPVILLGTFLLGPHRAVLLGLTTNALAQIQFVPQGIRDGDWKIARRVIIANYIGAAVGVWIFGRLDSTWLTLILGAALGLVAAAEQWKLLALLSERVDLSRAGLLVPLAGIAGLVSGVSGAGGIFFIAAYLRHVCPDARTFRGTMLLLSALLVGWRMALLVASGYITRQTWLEASVLFPVVFLGGLSGTWFYRRLPTARFYQIFQIVLLLAAASLIWKGLSDVT